jgi:toxin-antitoxin system PIN domain toxin
VIAVDTNILVYAHREESEWHATASERVTGLAEGKAQWALPWPCLHEFIAIVTHPRIFKPPTPLTAAIDQVDAWLESPSVTLLTESPQHWQQLRGLLQAGRIAGPMVHDARIAALCLQHGVRELWSVDRDFGRFPAIAVTNPLA